MDDSIAASSISAVSTSSSPSQTYIRGTLTVTFPRATKVTSLAIGLNGATQIAFLGGGKRSHYSRHFLRSQAFIIEPSPNSDQYTLVEKGTYEYPFAVPIPNASELPPSVSTPHGGTTYRLTSVLNVHKTAASAIMSFLTSPSTITSARNVQIYRKPTWSALGQGDASAAGNQELERQQEHEAAMAYETINHVWPGQLEAIVTLPYVQLPPKARPDLQLRIKVLRSLLEIENFQAALWERAVYRTKTIAGQMKVIAVKERPITIQRCEAGWRRDSTSTDPVPRIFEKIVLFTIPRATRSHKDNWTSRSLNPSSSLRIPTREEVARLKTESENAKDSEWATDSPVEIEIQHFIRFSVHVLGSIDAKGKVSKESVERVFGDINVVVRGFESEAETDSTGLPTYLGSFATSRLSTEEAHEFTFDMNGHQVLVSPSASPSQRNSDELTEEDRRLHLPLEDDAMLALFGMSNRHGSQTPPSYEETMSQLNQSLTNAMGISS
ncbi:hypothetical protein DFQ27_000806 [Actinomortierella ambigua]|uniref:Arrestin-like N-terminal domain-containing protein n=1 Tax=Actinomortierella ambigua TaxID=1343610 RepID=A0A9P6U8G4_9FUNG|nr:hypothetical protein DFQ27_000806 [Actinomortierella ambigua]